MSAEGSAPARSISLEAARAPHLSGVTHAPERVPARDAVRNVSRLYHSAARHHDRGDQPQPAVMNARRLGRACATIPRHETGPRTAAHLPDRASRRAIPAVGSRRLRHRERDRIFARWPVDVRRSLSRADREARRARSVGRRTRGLYITFDRNGQWTTPVALSLNDSAGPDYALSIAGTPETVYWKRRGGTFHAPWAPILADARARAGLK